MFSSRTLAFLALLITGLFVGASPALAADSDDSAKGDSKKDPTFDEMREHRLMLREDLMIPSLKGLRGISYGIPGQHPYPNLEKVVETKLKQLPIPITKIKELQSGVTKPVDGILQVKVLAGGGSSDVVAITLTQWCKLVRNDKVHVRTVTYGDQAVTPRKMVRETVGKMVDQFVIDYFKANNKDGKSKKAKG